MSNYLYQKYFGKYRILAPIDLDTNDFPRNPKGEIDTDDFYIPCKKYGRKVAEIYHYGHKTLGVLIFGANIGNKLIKLCEDNDIELKNIRDGDGEISFLFKADDMEFIADYLGASTQGKNIRPFSIKNLPKSDYEIPEDDYEKYKIISDKIPLSNKLLIARTTDEFLDEMFKKTTKKDTKNVEQDLRLNKMSRQKKEYIHMKGFWEEFIKVLEDALKSESLLDNQSTKSNLINY